MQLDAHIMENTSMEFFQTMRPFRAVTAALCVLLLASCGKKLPEPKEGKGPKYDLVMEGPTSTLLTTESADGSIQMRSGGQKVYINISYERQLECNPISTDDESDPYEADCRIVSMSFQYNNISASSEDTIEHTPFSPSEMLSYTPPEEQVRRSLIQELSKLKEWSNTLRFNDGDLTNPELTQDTSGFKDGFQFMSDIAKDLEPPKRVAESFIAGSIDYMPDHPVAVGAVWHITIPNDQFPEFKIPTAVTLESVSDHNGEKIAKLSTLCLFKLTSPTDVQLPSGERAQIQRCAIESNGEIILNLTRPMEESNRSTISMTYTIKQSGQRADCRMDMTTNVERTMSE